MSQQSLNYARFFEAWCDVCKQRQGDLLGRWVDNAQYTALVLTDPDSIIQALAEKLELRVYPEYYKLDAVFFRDEDLVPSPPSPISQTWLHNVRVAFEHENFFTSGLFQELSNLMISRAELRVLVTYPQNFPQQEEFRRLAEICSRSGLPDPAFLLITGRRSENADNITWQGFHFKSGALVPV